MKRVDFEHCLEKARLGPSAHNTQPALWHLDGDGAVWFLEDTSRRLFIGDPTARDQILALGCALEAFAMALRERGLCLTRLDTSLEGAPQVTAPIRVHGRLCIESSETSDPLQTFVTQRESYRAKFGPIDPDQQRFLEELGTREGVGIRMDAESIGSIAQLVEDASHESMLDPVLYEELWQWLRLSKSDPRYLVDGLNADALRLSGIERIAGAFLMAPSRYRFMGKLGLSKALISEKPQTRTSSAIAVFHCPTEDLSLDTGRWLYRLWLELTANGLSACPMSVLADHPPAIESVRALFELPDGLLLNVFRIGVAKKDRVTRARRSLESLDFSGDEAAGASPSSDEESASG